MAIDGKVKDDTPMVSVPLAKMNAEGKPVYVHGIHKLNDTAEVPALIRNAFTSQHDQNSIALLAGPDGIALRPGLLAVAEYGEGRVHLFDRDGRYRNTLKVSMPFVDTVIWDDSGNLYAGGAFQNTRPPFEGAVVRFPQSEWEKRP